MQVKESKTNTAELEKSQRKTLVMSTSKREMTGGKLVAHQCVFHFEFFRLGKSCESPTVLKVVRAGFIRSYRPYERNRFAFLTKSNS